MCYIVCENNTMDVIILSNYELNLAVAKSKGFYYEINEYSS
jgi:hypothetical protein